VRRAAWILVCVLWTAAAGDFAGLTPGVSTKADVDRVLGAPVREVVPGERYEYNPARHDAVRISVKFRRGAGIVETIDLYPQGSYAKAQYRQWFKLEAPDKPVIDERGNLIEYYAGPGIALNYSGPDDTSPVAFFSHFDLRILLEERPAPAPAAPAPAPAPPAVVEENRQRAAPLLAQARERMAKGDYDAAINLFNQGIRMQGPEALDIRSFEDVGFCYFRKKRYAEALKVFLLASRIDRRSPPTVYFLGATHDALGHREEALNFYRAYLGLNHSHSGWNRFARHRLEVLPREPERDKRVRENLDKLLETIQQEIRRK
jgi:tetratricopeptide (TPR) repeat protein